MIRQNLYQVCDLVIASSILIPELMPAPKSIPDYRFKLLAAVEPFAGEYRWFNQWVFHGDVRLSFAIRDKDYLLRFPHLADFLISRSDPEIRCHPLPGIPESAIRHLLVDSVIPLILSRREPLVLHASGILMNYRAIAFVGPSGQGKSTLAANYGRLGYPVIADDYLVLRYIAGDWVAVPSYPGVRLLPECRQAMFDASTPTEEVTPYTLKRRVSDPQLVPFVTSPAKVRCLYVLDEERQASSHEIAIEKMSRREVFVKLVSSSFNLDITDKELLKRQFAALSQIVEALPCFRLRYAREMGALPGVVKKIEIHHEGMRNVHYAGGSPQDRG
jgi:adenylate kinase family enzyme